MIELLVITSCIKPSTQPLLKITDWKTRLSQTINALKYFIDVQCFKKIVLCDGSNYDLNNHSIAEYAKKKNVMCEFLHFKQDALSIQQKGKGYGEGEIMKFIIENSKLYSTSSNFAKITGRLTIPNIKCILERCDESNIYFNIIAAKGLGCVDTRFYVMGTSIYNKFFRDAYLNVSDNNRKTYEYCFKDVLRNSHLPYKPFPLMPLFNGISGTSNVQYGKDCYYYTGCFMTSIGLMNTKFCAIVFLLLKIILRYKK